MKISTFALIAALVFGSFQSQAQQKGTARTLFGKPVHAHNQNPAHGYIRCATTEYEQHLQENDPKRATDEEFEAWINPLIAQYKSQQLLNSESGGIITIPVVVHVIHSGQAVGTAPNITDAQVESQITVMTNDFRRMAGTPGFNTNSVGADTQIQFVLAKVDPNGNPTNGINRVNLCQNSWSTGEINAIVKPATQWDPTQYLNMWSVNFSDQTLLGYAQFPNASGLQGLNPSGGAANTDGVVCNFATFGSINYDDGTFMLSPPYNEGRTMTHEVGHWLGLRHIWGDGGCGMDDFCADTPVAGEANYGCPANANSCFQPGNDMVENYMDYTDDVCMNIFTQNQKDRMVVIMNNAARRMSLKTSTKDAPIPLFANDAEVKLDGSCGGPAVPGCTPEPVAQRIALYNRGTSNLTTATISYSVNGGNAETYNWTGNLATHKFEMVDLPVNATVSGPLSVSVTHANGTADQRASNNTAAGTFTYVPYVAPDNYTFNNVVFRLQKDNYGSETTWSLKNSAGTTLYSGGPYTDQSGGGALITQNWTLPSNECYTFEINDAYGDGICCDYGNGFYDIKSVDGTVTLASGGEFSNMAQNRFTINALGTDDFTLAGSINVYPNPSTGTLNIGVSNELGLPDSYVIYNAIGQTIASKSIASENDLSINTSSYSSGLYFVRVAKDGASTTVRFIKQ